MELTRRGFFKAAGAAFATTMALEISAQSPALAVEADASWKLVNTEEYTNICCYCAGGCGSLLSVRDGELINLEGDPDNPINEGGLCPKGATMFQLRNIVDPETHEIIKNPERITSPMVRRSGSSEWEEISWDDAISEIARHVKDTRDETFIETNDDGLTVNYTPGIASLGGSQQNSEEEYLIVKAMRSLGIVAIDNQARVCHAPTVSGLAPTFGRGSMTMHWSDIQNTDVIMHIGSNSSESHPVSSKWLHRAHERGAKWIVIDPRYTRTAEQADVFSHIRPGTDIAFFGGMINYLIENIIDPNLDAYLAGEEVSDYNFEYLINYTNASYLLDPDYEFDVETGLFSGWNEETRSYDNTTWHYQIESESEWDTSEDGDYAWAVADGVPEFTPPTVETPARDTTLSDPMCVYQQMKTHYSRYDIDTVCSVCGMEADKLEEIYSIYCSTAAPDKSGVIVYSLGQTQHTYGSQNTRMVSVVQLMLCNIGVPGGGVASLRGEPNVQGATDMGMLVNEQPAYLKWPNTTSRNSLRAWLEGETYSAGYYTNKPKFIVSALKEWWGDNATVDNDYGYDWWPKVPSATGDWDYSHISTFELMSEGITKGYFNWGQNPCHSAPNASNVRRSMANLDWLVVVDQVETEASTFWKAPDMTPEDIDTEVYFLPCALIYEKPGIIVNSGRWLQWRYQAVDPWGDSKPDYEIVDLLWRAIVELYEQEGGANPDPILNTKWDYYIDDKIDPRSVSWALNGYTIEGSSCNASSDDVNINLLSGYSELMADGTTACATWIYSGFYNNADAPLDPAEQPIGRRNNSDESGLGLYSNWAYSWPNNRRVFYNRASCDTEGKPWNSDRVLVEWTGEEWNQIDVADFTAVKNDEPVPPNNNAFFMLWEQNARLHTYTGMNDGPFPEHYEPFETPLSENLLNGRLNSPTYLGQDYESTARGTVEDYPIVATSGSVTEMWQTGGQTRSCPALVEAMPTQFIEISEELAEEKGISSGDTVRVWNNRGSAVVDVVITKRLKPLTVNGKSQHQVFLTHHYGWAGVFGASDSMVNDLTPNVGDTNSQTPEYKAFLVNIEKA